MENNELAPREGETPEAFEARIEAKKRELDAKPVEVSTEPNLSQSPEPTIEPENVESSQVDKPSDTEPAPSSETVPSNEDKTAKVEEYARNKGWKSQEDIIQSYRELEKKLGEKSKPEPVQFTPPPAYQPPPFVPNRNLQQVAQSYGMDPGDLERLTPLVGDMAEVIAEKKVRGLRDELQSYKRETAREKEIERLKRDPAFNSPAVIDEMSRIMGDPRVQEQENSLTLAFQMALGNVGRKALEGTLKASEPPVNGPSTKPPITARGTGPAVNGNGKGTATKINPANFNALPLAEKERLLKASGRFRTDD